MQRKKTIETGSAHPGALPFHQKMRKRQIIPT